MDVYDEVDRRENDAGMTLLSLSLFFFLLPFPLFFFPSLIT